MGLMLPAATKATIQRLGTAFHTRGNAGGLCASRRRGGAGFGFG